MCNWAHVGVLAAGTDGCLGCVIRMVVFLEGDPSIFAQYILTLGFRHLSLERVVSVMNPR